MPHFQYREEKNEKQYKKEGCTFHVQGSITCIPTLQEYFPIWE